MYNNNCMYFCSGSILDHAAWNFQLFENAVINIKVHNLKFLSLNDLS